MLGALFFVFFLLRMTLLCIVVFRLIPFRKNAVEQEDIHILQFRTVFLCLLTFCSQADEKFWGGEGGGKFTLCYFPLKVHVSFFSKSVHITQFSVQGAS